MRGRESVGAATACSAPPPPVEPLTWGHPQNDLYFARPGRLGANDVLRALSITR